MKTITCPLLCLWWPDIKCWYHLLHKRRESASLRVHLLLHMCSLVLGQGVHVQPPQQRAILLQEHHNPWWKAGLMYQAAAINPCRPNPPPLKTPSSCSFFQHHKRNQIAFTFWAEAALFSCLAFISARSPLPITCTPYLRPPCGLPLLSPLSAFAASSGCTSSSESGVFNSSDRSVPPFCSAGFTSFLLVSTAGLFAATLGEEGSSATNTVWGRSDLELLDLIKLRKPLFLESLFFFSSPASLCSLLSELLVDGLLIKDTDILNSSPLPSSLS